MTDSQRALAAWAWPKRGHRPTPPFHCSRSPFGDRNRAPGGPERLAIAALAFHALGLEDQAREVAERLAQWRSPWRVRRPCPRVSVFGCGGAMAEAEVTALCALALERVDPKSPRGQHASGLSSDSRSFGRDQILGGSINYRSLLAGAFGDDARRGWRDVRVTMESSAPRLSSTCL